MLRSASNSTDSYSGWVSDRTVSQTSKPPPAAADEGYWLDCFFGDDLRHGAMVPENPAFSSWDVSGGRCGLDPSPGAMGGKADHGIPNPGTGTAGLAGRVPIRLLANRNPPSCRAVPRQPPPPPPPL